MTYNLTKVVNVNTTVEFVQNVNTELMNDYFGVIILMFLFAVFFIAFVFSSRQPVKSIAGASFLCFGFSIIMYVIDLVPVMAVWLCIIVTAIGISFWKLD